MSGQNNALTTSMSDNSNSLEVSASLDYTIIPAFEAADTLDLGSLTEVLMQQVQQPRRKGYGISLYLPGLPEPIELWNKPLIVLGRRAMPQQLFPNLDLTEHQALSLGISRLHAQIIFKNACFYVQDLASKNGTWFNTEQLTPYQPKELHRQDILRLGQLVIHIGACHSP